MFQRRSSWSIGRGGRCVSTMSGISQGLRKRRSDHMLTLTHHTSSLELISLVCHVTLSSSSSLGVCVCRKRWRFEHIHNSLNTAVASSAISNFALKNSSMCWTFIEKHSPEEEPAFFLSFFPVEKPACWFWASCLNHTLKNAGLKSTQLGLLGNPALGKYLTRHKLGYFNPSWFG